MSSGRREFDLLAEHLARGVVVEEVHVEGSLHHAGDDRDQVSVVVRLRLSTVDPVGNVEGAIQAKHENVVACEIFNLAIPLEDDELRQDSECLEVNGERPQNLQTTHAARDC